MISLSLRLELKVVLDVCVLGAFDQSSTRVQSLRPAREQKLTSRQFQSGTSLLPGSNDSDSTTRLDSQNLHIEEPYAGVDGCCTYKRKSSYSKKDHIRIPRRRN